MGYAGKCLLGSLLGSSLLLALVMAPVAGAQALTLQPPAATAQPVGDDEDFPFLAHLPQMTLTGTSHGRTSSDYRRGLDENGEYGHYLPPGGTEAKTYDVPDSLTAAQFVSAYAPALTAAGWTIDCKQDDTIYAHWDKNGRDIYVILYRGAGVEIDVIEVLPRLPVVLHAPAATRQQVSDDQDFPFLGHLSDMTLTSTDMDPSPMDYWDGNDANGNVKHIAPMGGFVTKRYDAPSTLDNFRFVESYETALKKAGWVIGSKDPSQGYLYARYDQDGRTIYASLDAGADMAISIAEPPPELSITLTPPAQTPETFGDKDNFPYITPLPGMTLGGSESIDGAMVFYTADNAEAQLVGSGSIVKRYNAAKPFANDVFATAYEKALVRAGWTIGQWNPDQGYVYAHYDKNGRNLYTYIKNGEISVEVTDVGASLKAALAKSCKVAVYGVNFDFNKATLRPDAFPVLQQVRVLFDDQPGLVVEVGGHTDNVGGAQYNQTLSEQRAAAVVQWLVQHGVAASRLTSHGYGESQPIVPNDTDANRARNRRVELRKPDCAEPGKAN